MSFLQYYQCGINKSSLVTMGACRSDISIRDEVIGNSGRSISGDLQVSTLDKIISTIKISCEFLTQANLDLFKQTILEAGSNSLVYFKAMNAGHTTKEYRTSTDVNTVKIARTSRRFITISGVWLASDPTKAGTNYYTGGSIDEETYTITLGTALSSANTAVFVEYEYDGWLGKIFLTESSPQNFRDSGEFTLSFTVEGK